MSEQPDRLTEIKNKLPSEIGFSFDISVTAADVAWLIAEVERLQTENDELRRTEIIYSYFADDNQTSTELKNRALREAPKDALGIHAYMRRLFSLDDED